MKKMKILALVMVMAFAALGGAYAIWSDTLTITETVTTGNVEVNWVAVAMTDPAPSARFGTDSTGNFYGGNLDSMDPNNPNEHKNVAYKDISYTPGEGKTTSDLTIEMRNVYPGYQESVLLAMKNLGTIPVKLELTGTGDIPSWLEMYGRGVLVNLPLTFDGMEYSCIQSLLDGLKYLHNTPGMTNKAITDLVAGLANEPQAITVLDSMSDLESLQINPGQYLIIGVIQRVLLVDVPQGVDYRHPDYQIAKYTITAVQWNAYDFELPTTITFPRVTSP